MGDRRIYGRRKEPEAFRIFFHIQVEMLNKVRQIQMGSADQVSMPYIYGLISFCSGTWFLYVKGVMFMASRNLSIK